MKYQFLKKHFTVSSRTLYLLLFCLLAALPTLVAALEQSSPPPSHRNCPQVDAGKSKAGEISLPGGARFSEHLLGLRGLKNVGRVTPEIYRGAQPTSEGYATLKEMGIKTVVNLRTTESERKEVEAAGMRSVEIPFSMFGDLDKNRIERVLSIMTDPACQPVFVHCKLGEDRTGITIAAYRMKVQGWPLILAEAEMDSFGFNKVWINLRKFIRHYAADLQRTKQSH